MTTLPIVRRAHRHRGLLLLALVATLALPAGAEELTPQAGYTLVTNLMSEIKKDRKAAAAELIAAGDVSLVPALVDAYFYTPRLHRTEMTKVLESLTGESYKSYYGWVEYVGRSEIETKGRYIEWKLLMLRQRDTAYTKIFYPDAPSKIRLEEIVSGGVPLDGIPSLDNPPMMPAAEAKYLKKNELVFGVQINGESRAYPRRFLSWHEMLNDVVGGEPVTLSYCTLCGSAILYSGQTQTGETRTFGTSGLLYRSNKLMYDRQSYTLWSNLTGEAVLGRLAGGDLRLDVLPMTLTTWREWIAQHPDTSVIDLESVERAAAGSRIRFPYVPGAADKARQGVEFPVWQKSDRLDRDSEIFALVLNGEPKAYPLDRLALRSVLNDDLGGEGLVVVTNSDSGAVRAFSRGDRRFKPGAEAFELVDQDGVTWRVTEQALEPLGGGEPLPRLTRGHIAYWFGWYGFYPQTSVWDG